MKKHIIAFFLTAAVALGTAGCGHYQPVEKNEFSRFRTVATYKDGWEIVDKDTGNTYFSFTGGGGVVPIFDEYGKPYKANGWRDYGG